MKYVIKSCATEVWVSVRSARDEETKDPIPTSPNTHAALKPHPEPIGEEPESIALSDHREAFDTLSVESQFVLDRQRDPTEIPSLSTKPRPDQVAHNGVLARMHF